MSHPPPHNLEGPDQESADRDQAVFDLQQSRRSDEEIRRSLDALGDLLAARDPAFAEEVRRHEEAKNGPKHG